MRIILHIDFNSYFATVEQQANPRLRGKPIGVTGGPARNVTHSVAGGDRTERTVIGAASIEAKKFGVKTGMALWQARQLCPEIIFVTGDSDKYLETTKRFLTILKDYSPYIEVFSIDECFLEIPSTVILRRLAEGSLADASISGISIACDTSVLSPEILRYAQNDMVNIAKEIKSRIKSEIGDYMTVSIGISYNKLMAKLASNLQKPDGLVVIPDKKAAIEILDKIELDAICGIGHRIKNRLFNLGVTNFKQLRQVPLEALLASFKSSGLVLYNIARGIDERAVLPFYEKEEVKSIGHRLTISHDTNKPEEIKQILLKLTELVARRLRAKHLVGKTVSCWIRYVDFEGGGMQTTILPTDDGLDLFKTSWKIFQETWDGSSIRMIGASISNLKPITPQNLSLLEDMHRKEIIIKAIDKINDRYGEFTLQRGILLQSANIKRMPNPFLSDRRFKV